MSNAVVGAMRAVVLQRDGGCVAPILDPEGAGPCYNRWGRGIPRTSMDLEADYIEVGATGPRHFLASDHVALCGGHHRGTGPQGGRIWAKQSGRREALRDYLTRIGR